MAAWQRMAEIGYTDQNEPLKVAVQNSWFGYYKAKDLHEEEGKEMPGNQQQTYGDFLQ